jgi:hypothetical protein
LEKTITPQAGAKNMGVVKNWRLSSGGNMRGMLLTRRGGLMASFLKAKKEPRYTSGAEMPNHSVNRARSVVKGTAPLDFWPHTNRLSTKKTVKVTPGKKSA